MMSDDKHEHEVSDPRAVDSGLELRLGEMDRDGALADGLERCGFTRVELLRNTAVGTGLLAGTLLTPATAVSADASSKSDAAILNFALALEYLQADFYTEAERLTALGKETARQARVVGAHERAHVEALRDVLGRKAIKKPSFNFRGTTEDEEAFRRTAVAFEDLSVAAYAGQAPRIESQPYLVAALGILAVEARHASWIRGIAGQQRASTAFDEPKSEADVRRLVRATRFVTTSRPRTTGRRNPRYTG